MEQRGWTASSPPSSRQCLVTDRRGALWITGRLNLSIPLAKQPVVNLAIAGTRDLFVLGATWELPIEST